MIREKGSQVFKTISEVAEELCIPQHVLRFWESKFPQVKPMKRAGGRRYYRENDVLLLKTIKRFLYNEGYTIKGVQKLLNDKGDYAIFETPISEPEMLEPIMKDFDNLAVKFSAQLNDENDNLSELENSLFADHEMSEPQLDLGLSENKQVKKNKFGASSFFQFLKKDTMLAIAELERQEDKSKDFFADPNQLSFYNVINNESKDKLNEILQELIECKNILEQVSKVK